MSQNEERTNTILQHLPLILPKHPHHATFETHILDERLSVMRYNSSYTNSQNDPVHSNNQFLVPCDLIRFEPPPLVQVNHGKVGVQSSGNSVDLLTNRVSDEQKTNVSVGTKRKTIGNAKTLHLKRQLLRKRHDLTWKDAKMIESEEKLVDDDIDNTDAHPDTIFHSLQNHQTSSGRIVNPIKSNQTDNKNQSHEQQKSRKTGGGNLDNSRCKVCSRVYISALKMKQHMKKFPGHGPKEDKSVGQMRKLMNDITVDSLLDMVSDKIFNTFTSWQLQAFRARKLHKCQCSKDVCDYKCDASILEGMLQIIETSLENVERLIDQFVVDAPDGESTECRSISVGEKISRSLEMRPTTSLITSQDINFSGILNVSKSEATKKECSRRATSNLFSIDENARDSLENVSAPQPPPLRVSFNLSSTDFSSTPSTVYNNTNGFMKSNDTTSIILENEEIQNNDDSDVSMESETEIDTPKDDHDIDLLDNISNLSSYVPVPADDTDNADCIDLDELDSDVKIISDTNGTDSSGNKNDLVNEEKRHFPIEKIKTTDVTNLSVDSSSTNNHEQILKDFPPKFKYTMQEIVPNG